MRNFRSRLCGGQDAKHHQTRLVFITVPGVRRGVVQILSTESKRFATSYSMESTPLVAMGSAKRNETTGNEFSAA